MRDKAQAFKKYMDIKEEYMRGKAGAQKYMGRRKNTCMMKPRLLKIHGA